VALDRYAVMGNPIAHSKSPQIHALFAQQTGQQLVYEKLLVPLDGLAGALEDFARAGGRGLSLTVPFKEQALELMSALSERAQAAGAVNTVLIEPEGGRYGDNTDGVGLVRDLRDNHGVALAGARILVLGAGGAVRGALPSLLAEVPSQIVIANRTPARAEQLAAHCGQGRPVSASAYAELCGPFDLVINGTAASLNGQLPPLPDGLLAPQSVCYDMMYAERPTVFQQWALAQGAQLALDGLGMLVEQAAEAFHLWRGVSPQTAPVIAALRQPQAHR
jgi:shikimate dehydrogenase